MAEEAEGGFVVNAYHIYRTGSSLSTGLQTAYLIISLAVALGCGFLLIFLVWSKEYLQKPRHYLRCNLAVDDIIFTGFMIPVEICWIFSQDTNNDQLLCWLQLLMVPPSTISTFGTYLMMALELYYFICHPLHYHDKVTTRRVVIGIGVVRSFALLFGLVPAAIRRLENTDDNLLCFPEQITSTNTIAIFMGIFQMLVVLVVLAIFTLYLLVFKEAKKQQERDENCKLWLYQTKASKTIVPHVIVLTVSGLTLVLLFVMARTFLNNEQKASNSSLITANVAKLLYLTASSMVNPTVYSFRQPEFRRALRQLCGLRTNVLVAPALEKQGQYGEIAFISVPALSQVESGKGYSPPTAQEYSHHGNDLPLSATKH